MSGYKSGLIGPAQKGKLPFTARSDQENVENEVPRAIFCAPKSTLPKPFPSYYDPSFRKTRLALHLEFLV
jgi:hypothetical protein